MQCIKDFGTCDNYNTEYSERLHIDLAKDAYRATNHKDKYAQMTVWLERKEKILRHDNYINWQLSSHPTWITAAPPTLHPQQHLQMAKHPSARAVSFETLTSSYGASFFCDALAQFVVSFLNPDLTQNQIEQRAESPPIIKSNLLSLVTALTQLQIRWWWTLFTATQAEWTLVVV